MLKILVKKQLAEVFRSYFYDAKNNRMRPKWQVIAWFTFFAVLMIGILGGIFTVLAYSMCGIMVRLRLGWLYFLIMSAIAVMLGAFGSVFNTYSGLYLAKDNDQLFSLPIPAETVMASRVINVYLLGAMYSAVPFVPALIVYWINAGISASRLAGGILMVWNITVIVLILSCILGWGVAKISRRLKHKSFVTAASMLAFIGLYYFFYFKAADLVRDLIRNALFYGEKIMSAASVLYLFGRMGEGYLPGALLFTAVTAVFFAIVWTVMENSFMEIAASGGSTEKIRYVEKETRQKSAFSALLQKEFSRFAASPNYMLNCGLGCLLIPAAGILFLIKGRQMCEVFRLLLAGRPGSVPVILGAMLCMITSMNNMAVPSVSLEGKSIWIPQSLPVEASLVLKAKVAVQLILTVIPVLFASVCAAAVSGETVPVMVLLVLMPAAYTVFSAYAGMYLGLKMPLLSWTNEIAPIKQGGAVMISIFGSWVLCAVIAGLYLLAGYRAGSLAYLLVWTVALSAGSLYLAGWLDKTGSRIFARLP